MNKPIVMLDKNDYDSLLETAYLLRSPNNATELLKGFAAANQNISIELNF